MHQRLFACDAVGQDVEAAPLAIDPLDQRLDFLLDGVINANGSDPAEGIAE